MNLYITDDIICKNLKFNKMNKKQILVGAFALSAFAMNTTNVFASVKTTYNSVTEASCGNKKSDKKDDKKAKTCEAKCGDKKAEAKTKDGKCGEGKCGDAKCGDKKAEAKTKEGKCGEGKCGDKKSKKEAKAKNESKPQK